MYADAATAALSRTIRFLSSGLLLISAYRRSLWLGSTLPHQATLFGPGVHSRLAYYVSGFLLSAVLDYLLQISRCTRCVCCVWITS